MNREKEKTATETEQFQQELRTLEIEKDEKLNARKAFLSKIDKALRDMYHRWMKSQFESQANAARAKTGFVALGKNGICSELPHRHSTTDPQRSTKVREARLLLKL